jgi:hypothetical protein
VYDRNCTWVRVDRRDLGVRAYVEETLTIRDRLSLTGALRGDGAGTFGKSYETALYPKVSASWNLGDEPFLNRALGKIHLRGAYGASGVEPPATAALTIESPSPGSTSLGTTSDITQIGNPDVRPERQTELEVGVDYATRDDRVAIEFTYYNKRSSDALVELPVATALGAVPEYENIGAVRNRGFEVSGTALIVDSRPFSWDVAVNSSVNHNTVITLGSAFGRQFTDGFSTPAIEAGYPLFSYFARPYRYADANHDGIIEPSEVAVDTAFDYVGPSDPTTQVTASTGINFLARHIRVSTQFDYRGGFKLLDGLLFDKCVAVSNCSYTAYRSTPLAEQAAVAAADFSQPVSSYKGFIEDGSFVRLREVAVTFTAPQSFASRLHATDLRVTFSGRNLALWTRYRGGDPELKTTPGDAAVGAYGSNGIPVAQYWLARVSLGF